MSRNLIRRVALICVMVHLFVFGPYVPGVRRGNVVVGESGVVPSEAGVGLDRAASRIAGMGVSGLVLVHLVAASGLAGAAAITTALSTLGGPFGMIGGVAGLILIAFIFSALTEFGIEMLASCTVGKLRDGGCSESGLIDSVRNFPVISGVLKSRIICSIRDNY